LKYEILFRVIKEYESPYPASICFQKGERVSVGELSTHDPDWERWLWCLGEHNNEAWVPDQYLKIEGSIGTLLRDYNARELSVSPGELVLVDEIINGFGMTRNAEGKEGWVPMKCLEKIEA
jgi:hypothetical protein